MNIRLIWVVVKDAGLQWDANKIPRLGAALAYYAMFSLAPLLVISIGIAGLVFGQEAARGQITGQVEHLVGKQGGEVIQTMVESASQPGKGVLGTVVGVVMLLVGATGLFGQLQDALNTVWEVRPVSGGGLWLFVRTRILTFSMVLGVAFLLLVSLILSSVLSAVGQLFMESGDSLFVQLCSNGLDFLVITALFATLFKFLPDVHIPWRDVWLGAVITSVLFTVGKFLIGFYLGRAGIGSAYGAAGSLVVLLVWLYYASQIFLFGAELTKAYATHMGSRIPTKEYAEPVTAEAKAKEGNPEPSALCKTRENGTLPTVHADQPAKQLRRRLRVRHRSCKLSGPLYQ